MEQNRAAVLRRTAFSLAVAAVFLYFLFWQLNFYLAESVKQGLYLFFAPVLICAALYFCGLRKGAEIKLLAAYMVWIVLTRVLNGDRVLQKEYLFVLDLALMLPVTLLGLRLDAASRRRFLNGLSLVLGVYFFALGGLCVYTYLSGRGLLNPVTGANLTAMMSSLDLRMVTALDTNPNVVAFWFFMGLSLLCYQFFTCENLLLRIVIAVCALLDVLVILLMQCRSVELAMAIGFGLLASKLFLRRFRASGRAAAALLFLLLFLVSTALCYLGLAGGGKAVRAFLPAQTQQEAQEVQETAAPASLSVDTLEPTALAAVTPLAAAQTEPLASRFEVWDARTTGRLTLFMSALQALREHPRILLLGQASSTVMDEINRIQNDKLTNTKAHCHNFMLQTLMLTGLPGLLLALAFCALLVICAFRALLDPGCPLSEILLWLPLLCTLVYEQFESGLFTYTDARSLFFFLMAGFALGAQIDRTAGRA